jgi:K+-transporting ATPase ATPase C chain
MRTPLRALLATVVLAVITGLLYPLAMTGFARLALHEKAGGSVVHVDGRPVGSALIGQQWAGRRWFYGRPSAISAPYDATTSSGSNLGPLSKALADQIRRRIAVIIEMEGPYHPGLTASQIPVDLVTASASGLDPDISPAAAMFEAARVASARDLSLPRVEALIRDQTVGRTFGILGEPRVNVLELNRALSVFGG